MEDKKMSNNTTTTEATVNNTVESKKNQLFINWFPTKLRHEKVGTNKETGNKEMFYDISVPCDESVSDSKYASISVDMSNVYKATKKDGTENPGFCNIKLGFANAKRNISVKKGDEYQKILVTNQYIYDMFEKNRLSADAEEVPEA